MTDQNTPRPTGFFTRLADGIFDAGSKCPHCGDHYVDLPYHLTRAHPDMPR